MLTRRSVLQCTLAAGLPRSAQSANESGAYFPSGMAVRVERMFKAPGASPNGLQATADGLWILDQGTNTVALVRYLDGKVIREFQTESVAGSGLTFDGQALWIASTYSRELVQVDANTGKTLKRFPSPDPGVVKWGEHKDASGAHGLEFLVLREERELWVANPPSARIYVVDPSDGSVRRSFPAPGARPHGIGWDPDGSLWCTESNMRSFFKLSRKNERILMQLMLPPTSPLVTGRIVTPHGMTVWQRYIWFSVAETGEVYRVPLPTETPACR